jgi:hypothetical protein
MFLRYFRCKRLGLPGIHNNPSVRYSSIRSPSEDRDSSVLQVTGTIENSPEDTMATFSCLIDRWDDEAILKEIEFANICQMKKQTAAFSLAKGLCTFLPMNYCEQFLPNSHTWFITIMKLQLNCTTHSYRYILLIFSLATGSLTVLDFRFRGRTCLE